MFARIIRGRCFTGRGALRIYSALVIATVCVSIAAAQTGRIAVVTMHAKTLENNVIHEPADRRVSIYLPPSYDHDPTKRYPVIYLLHGINDTDEDWTSTPHNRWSESIQGLMDEGIKSRRFGEMIVAMPNERTSFMGSFYTNSAATGNWDDFTSRELVEYVDTHYRTLRKAESRGVAGHSMGGYGALTLSMKHPDVYGALYAISPAAFDWTKDWSPRNPAFAEVLQLQSLPKLQRDNLYVLALICVAQAFTPAASKPPFYADFPFVKEGTALLPNGEVFERFEAAFPINMAAKYSNNLRQLRAIKIDAGREDEFLFIPEGSARLSDRLTSLGVRHELDLYNGDHRDHLWGESGRLFQQVLPFFWENLRHE